jgi:hypothetical protein
MAALPAPGAPAAPARVPAPPRRPGETTGIVVVPARAHARRETPRAESAKAKILPSAMAQARARLVAMLGALARARWITALALVVLVLVYLVLRR